MDLERWKPDDELPYPDQDVIWHFTYSCSGRAAAAREGDDQPHAGHHVVNEEELEEMGLG
jgi:hypothetical protein